MLLADPSILAVFPAVKESDGPKIVVVFCANVWGFQTFGLVLQYSKQVCRHVMVVANLAHIIAYASCNSRYRSQSPPACPEALCLLCCRPQAFTSRTHAHSACHADCPGRHSAGAAGMRQADGELQGRVSNSSPRVASSRHQGICHGAAAGAVGHCWAAGHRWPCTPGQLLMHHQSCTTGPCQTLKTGLFCCVTVP